ncbi:MAG: tRNA-specific adenosine deaminase [Candidatus Latescibacteria bacterium]|nr:tRNA-specific adenosine deaminase [Candidatus Latescibacterota bacterium]
MERALAVAQQAERLGEVPVGALIVWDGIVLGQGGNRTECDQDPLAHAEMGAIRQAAACLGSRRLLATTIYVTLEPCAMCAGAIVLARIPRLVFGAADPKTGACGSLRNVVQDQRLNHRCQVLGGVIEDKCIDLLQRFFIRLRAEK